MSYIDAVILGLVQGLTEFIPVSSSGHLVLVRDVLGISEGGLFFDVILHLGTLLAVIIYFRKDLLELIVNFSKDKKVFFLLIIGTIPAIVIGFFLSDLLEQISDFVYIVPVLMVVTGILFLVSERVYARKDKKKLITSLDKIKYKDATYIGLLQACALLPGVSRSGVTIVGGFFRSLKRETAAKFSFFLSIPAILAAAAYTTYEAVGENGGILIEGPTVLGFFVSFLSGLFAVAFLMRYIRKHGLNVFAYYLFAVSGILILFYLLR
ncbi:undecaprenyl-diphosphate phosphatase [Patescibacteria group bacterium]|nr:undecaprenyl-diphosphate phosphatase [Patescibacteria group bacterium]